MNRLFNRPSAASTGAAPPQICESPARAAKTFPELGLTVGSPSLFRITLLVIPPGLFQTLRNQFHIPMGGTNVLRVAAHSAISRAGRRADSVPRAGQPPDHGRRQRDAAVEGAALPNDSDIRVMNLLRQ